MSADAVLRVRGLCKSFDETEVVRSVDFEVRAGEIVGFVGPNGAGKSTTLRCLIGLDFPDRGEVALAGIDALRNPVQARGLVGYLPGETSLYRQMRGKELLDFGLGFHRRVDNAIVARCLAEFGLPLEQRVHSYSAGMKQQLALTVALAPDVPLYVLDEPDKALDPTHRRQLRGLVRTLQERGKSFLVSSHHLGELDELADRLLFLRRGELVPDAEITATREYVAARVRASFEEPPAPHLIEGLEHSRDGRQWSFLPAPGASELELAERLRGIGAGSVKTGLPSVEEIYDRLYLRNEADDAGAAA